VKDSDLDRLEQARGNATAGEYTVRQIAPDAVVIAADEGGLAAVARLAVTSRRNVRECKDDAAYLAALHNAAPDLIRLARLGLSASKERSEA